MTTCPKDCWGVRLNEEDIGEIDVTGSPWLTGTAGGSQSDPKRVLCDRLVRGEMNQDYIDDLGDLAAYDPLTHETLDGQANPDYVDGYVRPWLLLNAPDLPCESAYDSEVDGPEAAAQWYFAAYNVIKANDGHSGEVQRTLIGGPGLYGTFGGDGTSWWLERFLAELDVLNASKAQGEVDAKLEFYAVHDWVLRVSSYSLLEDHLDWVNDTMSVAAVQSRTCLDEDVDVWISETGHLTASACATAVTAMQALLDWLLASGFASHRVKKVFWMRAWDASWYSGGTPESPGTLLYWSDGQGGLSLTDTGKAWEEVKMSMIPMCKVHRNFTFNVSSGTDVAIAWKAERFDTDDMWTTVDDPEVHINTPGTYDITFNHGQIGTTGAFRVRATIQWKRDANDASWRTGPRAYNSAAEAWPALGLHTTLKLGAGGKVRIVVHHENASTITYTNTDPGQPGPELTVKLVSFDY